MDKQVKGNRDNKAFPFLGVVIADDKTNVIKNIIVPPKAFSTGSVGYYASDKLVNPNNPEARYQVSITVTLIGSKG